MYDVAIWSNMSKTSASVSSGVPNTEKLMKARGRRPRCFYCFEVFGTPDETRSTSFWHDFSISPRFIFTNEVYLTWNTLRSRTTCCEVKSDWLCSIFCFIVLSTNRMRPCLLDVTLVYRCITSRHYSLHALKHEANILQAEANILQAEANNLQA